MAAFDNILRRLFSQKVIIKKMPGNRLKNLDFSRLQGDGNFYTGKFKGVRKSGYGASNRLLRNPYATDSALAQIDAARQLMYLDYENMDSDSIIAGALDIYADECTTKSPEGNLIEIITENESVKAILHNLFYDILNIEHNLWPWTRTLCKFGDFFLYLPLAPGVGVVDGIPVHPSFMKRDEIAEDEEGQMVRFIYEGESASYFERNILKFHEVAHFRLLTDTNFLPYGKSLIEGARKVHKQLTMMEDAMLIHRIMRAPQRRIVKVDVGGIAPEDVDPAMEEIINSMKKVPYVDELTGDYNLRFNLENMLEDIYLAVRGQDSGTDISTLEGMRNEGQIEDIEYLRNRMMAYLKIPKAYLSYDEGVEGKSVLAAEDIRFARTIERIQKVITSELSKIAIVHLLMQGYSKEEATSFKLSLTSPSMIYERQKVDLMNEKINLIGNILEHKLLSRKYIYENILNLSPQEWENEEDQIITDLHKRFRHQQIEEEGNDPKTSGKSYGTGHDIAYMHMATALSGHAKGDMKSLYGKEDGRAENEGRPKKQGSFERDKDPAYGRDPSGRKTLQQPIRAHVDPDQILKTLPADLITDSKKILRENINDELNETPPSMLDESAILEE